MNSRRLFLLLFFFLSSHHSISAQVVEDETIDVWTRTSAKYWDNREVRKSFRTSVNLNAKAAKAYALFDSQYRQKRFYKGYYLADLFEGLKRGENTDTMLLRFKNGMQIPIDLQNLQRNRTSLFLALSIKNSSGKWQRRFPKLRKPNILLKDPRPLQFMLNKVVVDDPKKVLNTSIRINPFRFADSLEAVEFIDDDAFMSQYYVKGFQRGQEVYGARCRFCHSVRGVGGSYGWDFVDPLPIYKKRGPQSLSLHVRYQKNAALEHGLMMPQQEISDRETEDLWKWLKAVSTKRLPSYRP